MKYNLVILSLFLFISAVFGNEIKGIINASSLNIRAMPGMEYENIGSIIKGTEVKILGFHGAWVKISAPANLRAWIKSTDLQGLKVKSAQAKVYAGAGEVFSSYATLTKGDAVKIIRKKRNTNWVLIEAPPSGNVWVYGKFVKFDKKHRPKDWDQIFPLLENKTNTKKDSSEEIVDTRTKVKAKFSSLPAKAVENAVIHKIEVDHSEITDSHTIGVKKPIRKYGYIIPLEKPFGKCNYALATQINNIFYPLFYLEGEMDLTKYKWHQVTLEGIQHWVQGWPRPKVKIEKIDYYTDNEKNEE